MELQAIPSQARLMGLIDAAVCPPKVVPLLQRAGVPFLSVFAGLPEEELGPASLFLVSVDDTEADWFVELDQLDRQSPCLSLISSRVEMDALVTHLQAFLFADIGDNMTAMVRFFDPRNTTAVFEHVGRADSRHVHEPYRAMDVPRASQGVAAHRKRIDGEREDLPFCHGSAWAGGR
ncbi:DUF4123 domain-containing protein [Burkholderia cenocepacia]|uniref:DUF4123 domain-containing protein n=1 Tax=Burkholderia cenocepacia TaxID=95486 RepID=UPI001F1E2647|nr:DUF4123 domain-containing protein [Burkholderia cenocepacia]